MIVDETSAANAFDYTNLDFEMNDEANLHHEYIPEKFISKTLSESIKSDF